MRSRARPVRISHRMLANAGRNNNAIMSSADSLGPCCKHFFVCQNETNTITDIKGGVVIDSANSDITIAPGVTTQNAMNLVSWPNIDGDSATINNIINGDWYAPGNKDVLIVSCGKAIADSNGGGHLSFYVGFNRQLKVQPYFSTFVNIQSIPEDLYTYEHSYIATPLQKDLLVRNNGQDYIFAASLDRNRLGHWADGVLTGVNYRTNAAAHVQALWDDFTPDPYFFCGHSVSGAGTEIYRCASDGYVIEQPQQACTYSYAGRIERENGDKEIPGYWSGADVNKEVAQDYYFLGVFVFAEGIPSDEEVSEALLTMKAQAIAGQKVGYVPWVTLK